MTDYYERKPKRGQKRTKNQKRRDARWMAERRRRDKQEAGEWRWMQECLARVAQRGTAS